MVIKICASQYSRMVRQTVDRSNWQYNVIAIEFRSSLLQYSSRSILLKKSYCIYKCIYTATHPVYIDTISTNVNWLMMCSVIRDKKGTHNVQTTFGPLINMRAHRVWLPEVQIPIVTCAIYSNLFITHAAINKSPYLLTAVCRWCLYKRHHSHQKEVLNIFSLEWSNYLYRYAKYSCMLFNSLIISPAFALIFIIIIDKHVTQQST